jgi:hypothetical protein
MSMFDDPPCAGPDDTRHVTDRRCWCASWEEANAAQVMRDIEPWQQVGKCDKRGAALADKHYSRRTVGSPQFMPPGETVVLVSRCGLAVFGWWRPHPRSGIVAMNKLDGWTCSIFRNESDILSSELVLAAEHALVAYGQDAAPCGPDGMLTYVWDKKVRSVNPGFCFKKAGWIRHPTKPRSADGKKTLLWKSFESAGRP